MSKPDPTTQPRWQAKAILKVLTNRDFEKFYKHGLEDFITGHDSPLITRSQQMDSILDSITIMFEDVITSSKE